MSAKYDASAIEVLSGLDPVRRRPGMYTDTSRPNHLAHEVIDNSVDEALAGHCSRIDVTLYRRRLAAGCRRRPWHAGGHPSAGKGAGSRADPDAAALGRKILQQELPFLGRPARRGRVRRQRPVEEPGGLGASRRPGIQHELPRRQSREQARGRRQGWQEQHRHHTALLAGPEVFRLGQVLRAAAAPRAAGEGGAVPGPEDQLRGRASEAILCMGISGRPRSVPHRIRRRRRHAAGAALHRGG